jgi:glycosyltransferase involved in cell wall biosynthesis
MKLLVISAAFPPSQVGEADHALHLCERLTDRGLDVHVLTTKREPEATHFPFQVYPIMRGWSWRDLPRFARFLRRCAPDAVLLIYTDRDYDGHPMITFAPSISKTYFPSVPFVTQLETECFSRRTTIFTRAALKTMSSVAGPRNLDYVYGTLLLKSDHFIVLSERHLSQLSKSFNLNGKGKGVVIPPPPLLRMCPQDNGAARKRGRAALDVKSDDFVIAYYGYIYAEKGIETLVKAFQMLNRRRSNTRLVMIGGNKGANNGSSYLNQIHELAKHLCVADKITWTGEYASDSDEASVYLYAADACVFPFKYGVTLNRSSVATAASHGLPIVTTKSDSLESPFVNEENLLLCPPEDPVSIALAVDSIIANPKLRDKLRAGALRLAAEHFSWDKTLDRTIEMLTQ